MMTCAYRKTYLRSAMDAMGDAFDYAVNDCGIDGDDFAKMLVGSPICKKIENGEPEYLVGKSGVEWARECVQEATGKQLDVEPGMCYDRSPEYWAGWAVAYYQWRSSRNYSEIFEAISFGDLLNMYYPLHEADVGKFAEIVDGVVRKAFPDTNLKRLRTIYGISQNELAKLSGVNLRSIQMYEQRKKDINRAGVITVRSLASALGCAVEDLIEKEMQMEGF